MSKKEKDLILGHKLEEIIPNEKIREKFIEQLYKKEDLYSEGSIFRDLLQGFVNSALNTPAFVYNISLIKLWHT